MAHEIEIIDNVARMLSVGDKPWHGLGINLQTPPESVAEAMKLSGLDWSVDTFPVQAFVNGTYIHADEAQAVVRLTDNKVLGVVGARYQPLQNAEAFDFFNPVVENKIATIETCGSLRSGKRVWMLAKIAGMSAEVLPGDEVNGYFLVSNSHDGTTTVQVGFTPVRVVCNNTLTLAHSAKSGSKLLKVKHTKNVVDAMSKIQEIIDWQAQDFSASIEQMKLLAHKGVTETSLKEYVRQVFEIDESDEKKLEKVYDKIIPLFEAGKGTDISGVRGTLWGAYNSITEYHTWNAARNSDNRLNNLWFGQTANTNARALEVAVKMAA